MIRSVKEDLVSIITPSYNSGKFISEAIQSIIDQSYNNWGLIIVDDCSTDNSWEIIKGYALNDDRIKYFKLNNNSGSGIARNKAISKASGKYMAFLDSDDLWHKDKLQIQIGIMKKKNISFSHTSFGYIDERGNKIKGTFHVGNKPVTYNSLLKRTEISCLTAIYNADSIGKFYMSKHRRKQDYALWLSILKSGINSYGLDVELAYYRQVKNSATSKKYNLILKHFTFLKDTQDFNTIEALYYTFYWMINGFIKYYIK